MLVMKVVRGPVWCLLICLACSDRLAMAQTGATQAQQQQGPPGSRSSKSRPRTSNPKREQPSLDSTLTSLSRRLADLTAPAGQAFPADAEQTSQILQRLSAPSMDFNGCTINVSNTSSVYGKSDAPWDNAATFTWRVGLADLDGKRIGVNGSVWRTITGTDLEGPTWEMLVVTANGAPRIKLDRPEGLKNVAYAHICCFVDEGGASSFKKALAGVIGQCKKAPAPAH
jgi:hypothetical protein